MKQDVKILELIDTYYPTVDGAINAVNFYARNLNQTATCDLAVPSAPKKSKYKDEESFKVLRCRAMNAPSGYRNALPAFDRNFKKAIRAGGYDIIHTHSPFALGKLAVAEAKRLGVPVVATLHTKYKFDFERVLHGCKPLVNFMIRYIIKTYNKADYVWTVSEASKQVLREYGYTGEIDVVRNGTDYVYPENASEFIDIVNAKHGLSGQKNVFVFVGRMAMYKNIPLICDALKILKDKNYDFKFIFAGGGFDLEKIKRYAIKLDVADRCVFTGEIKNREMLSAYYLRGDLLVFPSSFDMASVVKLEAAAHKKPALLIRGSCSAEMVNDGENGFLCEETVQSLANKLEELIATPEKLITAGENAYKTLYRTWGDVCEEVLEKYNKIIEDYKQKNAAKTDKK